MAYSIQYYSDSVQADVLALPATLLARYVVLSQRMQQHGVNLGEPRTKALGDGLFELRLKGAEGIARVCYCTLARQRIVMLHCFVKKSQKTPAADLQLAQARLKEVKDADARRTDKKSTAKSRRPRGSPATGTRRNADA